MRYDGEEGLGSRISIHSFSEEANETTFIFTSSLHAGKKFWWECLRSSIL
jgi:hypothetical protein